jgi:plasmid stabilization system protein ParE
MKNFEVSRMAENDIADSVIHYNDEKQGLGEEFKQEVEKTFDVIKNNPYTFQKIDGNTRRGLTKRFTHGVFYVVTKVKIIITRVLHTSRSPEEWTKK